MKNFQQFYKDLHNNPSEETTLKIKGVAKKIKAMVRLTTRKTFKDGGEYTKIIFDDHSFLLVLKNEEELYYADEIIGHVKEIPDREIGQAEKLMYNGKEYVQANKDDYQFVLELLVGSPLDIEGECRFSDYEPVEGTKEFLSLGWLSRTGERADINPKFIDFEDVEVLRN